MRINGLAVEQLASLTGNKDLLSKLKVGDVLKAQVLEISAKELVLRLQDGSVVKASAQVAIAAELGEILELAVSSKGDQQLFLETVKSDASPNTALTPETKKQLSSLGIKPDSLHVEIAEELKKVQLPLTKEVIHEISSLMKSYKSLSPERAAFLLSNNLTPDERSISRLSMLVDEKVRLGAMIEKLFSELEQIEAPNIKASMNLPKEETLDMTPVVKTQNSNSESVPKAFVNELQALVKNHESVLISSATPKEGVPPEQGLVFSKQALLDVLKNFSSEAKTVPIHRQTLESILSSTYEPFNTMDTTQKEMLTEQLFKLINKYSSKENLSKEALSKEALLKGDSLKRASEIAVGNLTSNPSVTEKEASLTQQFSKMQEEFLIKIDSENLASDLDIKKLYGNLLEKLDQIKSTLLTSLASREGLLAQIDQIQDSLKFINEVSVHHSYVQIPLLVGNQQTTGELYVLKNKQGKKKIDPSNSVVLLALDTASLGHIESLIRVDKKNISIHMRVQEDDLISFIKENYRLIYNALANKGYKLVDMKYRLIENETTVLNARHEMMKETSQNKSIDLKI